MWIRRSVKGLQNNMYPMLESLGTGAARAHDVSCTILSDIIQLYTFLPKNVNGLNSNSTPVFFP